MNLFAHFGDAVSAVLENLAAKGAVPGGLDLSRVVVEAPRDSAHGDVTTNAALVLAKQAGVKPRNLADKIIEELSGNPDIQSMSVAGPGFINMSLSFIK